MLGEPVTVDNYFESLSYSLFFILGEPVTIENYSTVSAYMGQTRK